MISFSPIARRSEWRVYSLAASGPVRIQQVAVKVTDPGRHTSFRFAVEAEESGTWVSMTNSFLNPGYVGRVTDGVLLLTRDEAMTGLILNYEVVFSQYRFAFVGNSDDSGSAIVMPRSPR